MENIVSYHWEMKLFSFVLLFSPENVNVCYPQILKKKEKMKNNDDRESIMHLTLQFFR